MDENQILVRKNRFVCNLVVCQWMLSQLQPGGSFNPPRRFIYLADVGYQTGGGTEFALKPGTCILTTDTHGKGHNSWNAGQKPVHLALIRLL